MEILYVTDEACKIHKSADTLVVRKASKKVASIPLVHLKCLVLFGYVQLSTQVMHQLMSDGVNILYFDYKGDVQGIVLSDQSNNVLLRIAQFKLWQDEDYRLAFSKSIGKAKVRNQLQVLEAVTKHKPTDPDLLHQTLVVLRSQLKALDEATSIQAVMGFEGISAKAYFAYFSKRINEFTFSGRQRRPAKEPVNALLNYAYAFLRNEMIMRLSAYGFDVELGYMHGVRYGRDSLALDLMEAFRPIFADQLVVHLLQEHILMEEHFSSGEEGCVLTPDGVALFCSQYEMVLNRSGVNGSWFDIFDKEIKRFRSSILASKVHTPYSHRGLLI